MKQDLIANLAAVGKPTELYECPDGSGILILPYGGRVLGLFTPQSQENFYWTHPALDSAPSARAFYDSADWHNSGGDRTWLAPEVDLFYPNYPDQSKYHQPRGLDPGRYQPVKTKNGFTLVNRLACTIWRLKQTVELEMTKTISPAANPLRHEHGGEVPRDLEYAGYTQCTSLAMTEPDLITEARIGLWNLIQMPHGGDLLIPTYARTQPKVYFGSISSEDLIVDQHLVRYRMRAAGEHKIGVRAVATAGRVGYLFSQGRQQALIIRNFSVNPSGEYVDVPWTDLDDLSYSTQACNIHSDLGRFSELEYHVPAVGGGTGRTCCDDWSQVWAFRGSPEQILRAARILLGSSIQV